MGELEFPTGLTLTGRHVALVPVEPSHAAALHHAARDPEVGRYLRHGPGATVESTASLIEWQLAAQRAGTDLPFTVLALPERTPIGMTRYLAIDRENRSVEVGGTWIDSALWRTATNTESKYLLLRHAFEREAVHRVQFQTDLRNERSQRAIERLGAVREAVLRDDVILPDGHLRSSVYYSVLTSEWPAVKQRLESFLARDGPAGTGRSGAVPATGPP